MNDLYLRFDDEAQAAAAVEGFRNVDVIGTIYTNTGTDEEPVMIPGWHVNVRVMPDEDATALEAFAVVVNSPVRVWA